MSITNAEVVVGTTATLIAAANRGRRYIAFSNPSGTHIHLGGASVTTTSGIRLDANEDMEFHQQHENDHTPGQAWYAVSASGTQTIGVTISVEDSTT